MIAYADSRRSSPLAVVFAVVPLAVATAGGAEKGLHVEKRKSDSVTLSPVSVVDDDAVAGAHDVDVRGGLAFVAGKANKYLPGRAGRFAVVDVSDVEDPTVLSALSEETSPALHNAETVLPLEDVCWVGTNALIAVDVEDPKDPRILSIVRHDKVDRINGMVRQGDRLLAASKSGRIVVFDVSDPRRPRFVGAIDTRRRGDIRSPHDIARFGEKHVAVPGAGKNVPVHFGLYRVGDGQELHPPRDWTFVGGVSDTALAGANRIATDGSHAYVVCHYSHRLGVVDLTDPQQPALVADIPTAGYEPDGLALDGETLFIGAGRTVEAVDVSDPASPTSLTYFHGEPIFTKPVGGGEANAHDLVLHDGHVYVTAQRDGRLGILRWERDG